MNDHPLARIHKSLLASALLLVLGMIATPFAVARADAPRAGNPADDGALLPDGAAERQASAFCEALGARSDPLRDAVPRPVLHYRGDEAGACARAILPYLRPRPRESESPEGS
jgi:hypothetical protein